MGYKEYYKKLSVPARLFGLCWRPYLVLLMILTACPNPLSAQAPEDSDLNIDRWGAGLTWRTLGFRSFGFYSFNQSNPALQVVYNLSARSSMDGRVRFGGRDSELLHASLIDISMGYRRWVGKHNRSFFRASSRRVLITTKWQPPLDGQENRHHWGIGVGFGRKFRLINDLNYWLVPTISYEVLVDHESSWYGRLHLDVTVGYKIGTR